MTKETLLEEIYDLLYEKAEAILKRDNPCEHKMKCGVHSCLGKKDILSGDNNPQCCCEGCPFWDKGCKAEKPLTCKTWLCRISKKIYPETYSDLNKITQLIDLLHFWVYRGDKRQSLNQANSECFYSIKRLKEIKENIKNNILTF